MLVYCHKDLTLKNLSSMSCSWWCSVHLPFAEDSQRRTMTSRSPWIKKPFHLHDIIVRFIMSFNVYNKEYVKHMNSWLPLLKMQYVVIQWPQALETLILLVPLGESGKQDLKDKTYFNISSWNWKLVKTEPSPSFKGGGYRRASFFTYRHVIRIGWGAVFGGIVTYFCFLFY